MDPLALLRSGHLYRRATAVISVVVVAVLASAVVASAAPPIDLGTLPGFTTSEAVAVNDSGQVVGSSETSGGEERAFSWTQTGGMVDLGTLPGFANSRAVAVNATGQVIGNAYTSGGEERAFSWTRARGMVDLGTLPGFAKSRAVAVNAAGQVIGNAETSSGKEHAFSWTRARGMVDLGTLPGFASSRAVAINDSGQVVGNAWTHVETGGYERQAFSWTDAGGMVDLGTLEGSESAIAVAVNDSGQVVGDSYNRPEGREVFSWTQAGGMVALGTGGGTEAIAVNASGQVIGTSWGDGGRPLGSFSWTQAGGLVELGRGHFATAINDSGQVIGNKEMGLTFKPRLAFSWTHAGGLVELEALPATQTPITFTEEIIDGSTYAWAINDSGQVVGSSGTSGGYEHAALWNTATGSVSLASTTINVDKRGEAGVMLTCTGTAPTCGGSLTLTAQTTIGRGKRKRSITVTIGTISGLIPSGETTTVELHLNPLGRALLLADHGGLAGTLAILKSTPAPSEEQTASVSLVQE